MRKRLNGVRKKLRRPTYAEIVATLALFIALGGVSYAAIQIPKNSVGSKQLKKNAVTSIKVKNRSLLARDFKKGQLPRGARGPSGSPGADGLIGATGPAGLPGADGLTGPIGPMGATGPPGQAGATGEVGPTGADGSDGSPGATGETGPTGETGSSGTAVMGAHSSLSAFPQYFANSGVSAASPAKTGVTTISPTVPVTAGNFVARLGTAPGVGNIRAVYLMDDGDLVLGCLMSNLMTTCNNTDTNAVIDPESELVMFSSTGGSPVASEVDVGFTVGP